MTSLAARCMRCRCTVPADDASAAEFTDGSVLCAACIIDEAKAAEHWPEWDRHQQPRQLRRRLTAEERSYGAHERPGVWCSAGSMLATIGVALGALVGLALVGWTFWARPDSRPAFVVLGAGVAIAGTLWAGRGHQ